MWQPFSEAPKDGTPVLVRWPNGNMRPLMWIKPWLYEPGSWKSLDGWPWPGTDTDTAEAFSLIATPNT